MAIEYFLCYHSYRRTCEKLTDQELGRLFRALMEYSETGEKQELAGRESIAFDFIVDDIDRAKLAYEEKCQTNKANGSKGGRPKAKKPNGFSENPKNPNKEKEEEKEERKEYEEIKAKKNNPPLPPFERFWQAYPKKVGKLDAERAFQKAKAPIDQLLSAVERQKKSDQWIRENGRFIPNPATWLNQGRWDDVLLIPGETTLSELDIAAIRRIMAEEVEPDLAEEPIYAGDPE